MAFKFKLENRQTNITKCNPFNYYLKKKNEVAKYRGQKYPQTTTSQTSKKVISEITTKKTFTDKPAMTVSMPKANRPIYIYIYIIYIQCRGQH